MQPQITDPTTVPLDPTLPTFWYGPPGVGKSTSMALYPNAVDLEHLPDKAARIRFLTERGVTHSHYGAADLHPSDVPFPANHVLVLPPPDVYYPRRAHRDRLQPAKARQPDVYPGFSTHANEFQFVVRDFPPAHVIRPIRGRLIVSGRSTST